MTVSNFWKQVSPPTDKGCREWLGAKICGYGQLRFRNQKWRAHRVSYLLTRGQIPDGAYICHKCDNPSCVNPQHLYLGDAKSNSADMYRRGRGNRPKGEGHYRSKFTEKDILAIRANNTMSQAALGKKYGVTPEAIHYIKSGKSWRHVRGH